ncbi:MAG: hypothetical protein WBA66_01965 [Xanthobacteraceae bacterium]
MLKSFGALLAVFTMLLASASVAPAGLSSGDRPATSLNQQKQRRPNHDSRPRSGQFDGRWVLTGVSTNCQGSGSGAFRVSGTRVVVLSGGGGHVSPSGAFRASTVVDGVRLSATGRLASNSGSGSYRRSDGCIGRWTAVRQ